jgi:hypothetical protein
MSRRTIPSLCAASSASALDGVFEQLLEWERARLQAVLQGLAAQHFHHDELLAAVPGNFVDGADVGMVQSRGGAGLAAKNVQGFGGRAPTPAAEI